ncbi:uncharacterized protein C8orf88 homolog isoform X3 [Hyperolius riggenbachi]|uniref:uncharacterized protein C8orf88 homolog isoform X3 n=1 Tax=Hyperolius riggenbachi TaxID=752182 RepID=UPI0035A28D22
MACRTGGPWSTGGHIPSHGGLPLREGWSQFLSNDMEVKKFIGKSLHPARPIRRFVPEKAPLLMVNFRAECKDCYKEDFMEHYNLAGLLTPETFSSNYRGCLHPNRSPNICQTTPLFLNIQCCGPATSHSRIACLSPQQTSCLSYARLATSQQPMLLHEMPVWIPG